MQKAKQFFQREKGEAEDPQFESMRAKFKQIRKDLQAIQEALKKHTKNVAGLVKPLDELALSVSSFYEVAARPGSEHDEQGKNFSRAISSLTRLMDEFEVQHNLVQDIVTTYLAKLEGARKEMEERDKTLDRFQEKKKEYTAAQTKEKDPAKLDQLKTKFQAAKEAYDQANDTALESITNIVEQACDDVDPAYQKLVGMHAKLFRSLATSFEEMKDSSMSSPRSSSNSSPPRSRMQPPQVTNPDSFSQYSDRPSLSARESASPSLPSRDSSNSFAPPMPARVQQDSMADAGPRLPARPVSSIGAPALPSRDSSQSMSPPPMPARDNGSSFAASTAVAAASMAAQPPLPSRSGRTSVYGMDAAAIQQQGQAPPPSLPSRSPAPAQPTPSGPPSLPTRAGPSPSQPPLPVRNADSSSSPPMLPGRNTAPAPAPGPAPALPPSSAAGPALPFPTSSIPEEEQKKYMLIFRREDPEESGQITGQKAIGLFGRSGLPQQDLALIWEIADQNKDGTLSRDEFVVAMYLINSKLMGRIQEIPDVIPPELVIRSSPAPSPTMSSPPLPGRNYGAQPPAASAPPPSLPNRGPSASMSYAGGPPSLPGRGGGPSAAPQPPMSMRQQADAKADELGAQMRQKAQQKAGQEAAKAAMNEKNQEAFGNYVASNSDNAAVGYLAKNKYVQQQGGAFLAKQAQDERVQQAAGDLAIRGAKSGAKAGASAAKSGASNFDAKSFF